MATETLRPNGELSDAGLVANSELDHDEDPDVSSVTINATGNNVSTEWGGDFPTPTGNPTVGADLQEFRVGVEEFDSGQTGTPQARIELWENGIVVRAGTDTDVSTYAVLAFTWNANELATADGSLVQCKLIGTKTGGGPGVRNTVRIGHMEWNVDYSVGTQELTPSLVTTEEAFFASTITVGAVDLTPALVATEEAFFTATVTVGAIDLTPDFNVSEEAFFAPTVNVGAVTLTPDLVASEETFFTHEIAIDAVDLTPSFLTTEEAFFAATVSVGAVDLTPGLVASEETFFAPTVTTTVGLTPKLSDTEEAFFAPTVTAGAVTLTPSLVTTEEAFFAPTVEQPIVEIIVPLIAAEEFFFPAIMGGGSVRANNQYFTTDTHRHRRVANVGIR